MTHRTSQRSDDFNVSLANEQSTHTVNERQLTDAVTAVLRDSTFTSANISIAIVDDPTMHKLNRQYLEHDYPTDVLSFVLEDTSSHLEGEVILSADTAATEAAEHGWSTAAEMLLYVVHGTLHLIGYRDKSSEDVEEMRAAERKYVSQFGFEPSHGGRLAPRDESPLAEREGHHRRTADSSTQLRHEGDGKVTNSRDRRTGR
jgi:probable rRNA maturation factor